MLVSRQFTTTEKILLVFLTLILLGIGYYWLVHVPVSEQYASVMSQQEQVKAESQAIEEKVRNMSKMKEELAKIKTAGTPTVETAEYDNLQSVVTMLNSIMPDPLQYQMTFQPPILPENTSIMRRPIDMTFACSSYEQAKDVITRLHDGPFRCQISTMTVAANGESRGEGYIPVLGRDLVFVTMTITYFEIVPT